MNNIKNFLLTFLTIAIIGSLVAMTMKKPSVNASRIKITNKSNWDIDHIYFSPVDREDWGNDILGNDDILEVGESVEVMVDCADWDVKFIAEDGAECIVENLEICEIEGLWTIDDIGCD
jgi:hypothetical protein